MRSREFAPCEQLRPFVRLIWVLELDDPVAFGPPERVCPDGLLELVFHFRTPLDCRYDGKDFEPQPRSAAVSQTHRFLEFRPRAASGLISVRFHPWGAHHFFGLPLSELADRQVSTHEIWGHAACELEERLEEASSDRARVQLLEDFLLGQLECHHKEDVEPLVRAVWNRKGCTSVPELCRDLGVGERRLQRTFAAALGTTPKGFSRLARFLHACSLLRVSNGHGLADVGLACGFYDQSHLIAEFKAFSGVTPGQFVETARLLFLELV